MDKLFSNIQQSLNNINKNNDKQNILKEQQINQDKINELLEQSSEIIMCGPSCQKMKKIEDLKEKYLDAETNLKTAPIKLEESKKNYYIYKEGRPYYDNLKEEELKQKAKMISKMVADNFTKELSNANTMNIYLNTALLNSKNTKELLKEYLDKNEDLKFKLRNRKGDILTNDRKTYYETDALDRLQLWYLLFWRVYYYLIVVVYLCALILSPSNMSIIMKVVSLIIIILLPYILHRLNKLCYNTYNWLWNKIPKNVYNNL